VEAVAGLAYVVGPVVGGLLFSEVGFQWTLMILASLHIIVLALVPVLLKGLSVCDKRTNDDPGENDDNNETPPRDAWKILSAEKVVWVAAVANTLAYGALSFYDIAISPQLERTLGLGARGRGFIYFIPCVIYTCLSPLNGEICRRLGTRRFLVIGCLIWAVALIACGPSPPLAGLGERRYEWGMVSFAMIIYGFAMVPVLQAPLAMMSNHFGLSSSVSESRLTLDDAEKVGVEDAISAIMAGTLSLGCTLGPILGGLGLEYLPKSRDPGCVIEENSHLKLSENGCSSAFGWTTTLLAATFVLLAIVVASLRFNQPLSVIN
jgi:MFS family permease